MGTEPWITEVMLLDTFWRLFEALFKITCAHLCGSAWGEPCPCTLPSALANQLCQSRYWFRDEHMPQAKVTAVLLGTWA